MLLWEVYHNNIYQYFNNEKLESKVSKLERQLEETNPYKQYVIDNKLMDILIYKSDIEAYEYFSKLGKPYYKRISLINIMCMMNYLEKWN